MMRMCGWLMTASLAAGLVGGLAGCKSGDAVKQGRESGNGNKAEKPSAPPASAPVDPATLGTVSGAVHFSGKAPAPVKIDMSMDPVCSMTGGDNFAEQYVVHNGKLANVYVYIKSGPPAAMSAPAVVSAPVIMDQVGCKYVPHVVAVMRGGSVEFRNSDGTMHNIHTLPTAPDSQSIDISQGAKGAPQVKQFNQTEVMIPVRCNNHPWMNAFVNVSATPFFAVTDTNGHFGISGLPAGTYTIAAVHEKFGEQTMRVTVEPKETVKADFNFSAK
jgi:plastocyanin